MPTPRKRSSTPNPVTNATSSITRSPKKQNKDLVVFLVLLFAAFSAVLLIALFEFFPILHSTSLVLGLSGIAVLICFSWGSYYIYKISNIQPKILGAVWTLVLFTAILDTIIVSALLGYIESGNFYNVKGERYFQSPGGAAMLGWDGTFHVIIQFYLAWLVMTDRDHTEMFKYTALVWCGSIINSMAPLLLGALTGPFSHEIQLATVLNAPYVVFPVVVATHVINKYTSKKKKDAKIEKFVGSIFVLFHVFMAILLCIRTLVALNSRTDVALRLNSIEPVLSYDKSNFVRFQALQWMFYFVPYHLVCAYDIVHRMFMVENPSTFFTALSPDFAALSLGAYLQANCVFIVSSVFDWVQLAKPMKWHDPFPSAEFWVIELLVMLGLIGYLFSVL